MSKLVSILIPYYKDEHIIARTLASIVDQDYTDYEIIVVCDGEELPEKVKDKYGDKIILQENKLRHGAPATRNDAGEIAKGDYILFWDADSLMKPGSLRKYVNALEMNDADVAHCAMEFSTDPRIEATDLHSWNGKRVESYWELCQANLIDTNTMDRAEYAPLWKRVEAEGILLFGSLG
jgi:glycosyltransferase involved in cell wall biosynthesis